MRLLFVSLMSLVLLSYDSYSQSNTIRKVYLFNPTGSLKPANPPSNALSIKSIARSGYTLVETDMDSLALITSMGETVYLLLEPGKTYYYGQDYNGYLYHEITANAFWLSVATWSRSYRHYSVTKKSGVVELKDN